MISSELTINFMKEIQQRIKKFCAENDMESSVEHRLIDTMSELGEVAKEVLKMSNYGRKPVEYSQEFKSELGDVLFSLITVSKFFFKSIISVSCSDFHFFKLAEV